MHMRLPLVQYWGEEGKTEGRTWARVQVIASSLVLEGREGWIPDRSRE